MKKINKATLCILLVIASTSFSFAQSFMSTIHISSLMESLEIKNTPAGANALVLNLYTPNTSAAVPFKYLNPCICDFQISLTGILPLFPDSKLCMDKAEPIVSFNRIQINKLSVKKYIHIEMPRKEDLPKVGFNSWKLVKDQGFVHSYNPFNPAFKKYTKSVILAHQF